MKLVEHKAILVARAVAPGRADNGQRTTLYDDPIKCPTCGKVFGEWELVQGRVVIKKWCPACKKMVYIKKP